jgi:hypothetical protein
MSADVSARAQSQYRVEKTRTEATLTLSNGSSVRGYFFVSENSAEHAGRERITDVLNGDMRFLPFEVKRPNGSQTILFNRDHIVMATLHDGDEARQDSGYSVATHRRVSILLSNGDRLHGMITIYRPQGRDRLSDFDRTGERFKYVETDRNTFLVNVTHIVQLLEETSAP